MVSIFLSKLLETTKPDGNILWFFCEDKNQSCNSALNIMYGLMMYCVLDALDECDETCLKTLLFKLKTLSVSGLGDNVQFQLKFPVTSRGQPQCLPQCLSTSPRITLSDLEDDIGLYISEKVTQLARVKNIQGSPLQERIEKTFRSGAGGTFLCSRSKASQKIFQLLLIHLAAAQGIEKLCKELVEKHKYDIEWKTYDGLAPLLIDLMRRHLDLAQIMITRWGATLPSEIGSFKAIIHGLLAERDSLIEGFKLLTEAWGFHINTFDDLGNTIFHDPNYDLTAVLRGIEICNLQIDWDNTNHLGQTFLHCNSKWLTDPVLLSTFLQQS
ncbi:hypothetical protein FGADI_2054 [Fusarium gaditjirri]|uniref:Uncharacterized protein n=1 Tax=Fusarium gaditjirri TaxID=282569 RepID=A0A8H4TJ52_9HYPO|nr:hypothetical protein FGADI_2054 [Fusarium gaditjirri]